jgi:hypothetical protein
MINRLEANMEREMNAKERAKEGLMKEVRMEK